MSFLRNVLLTAPVGHALKSLMGLIIQIRTATKRVSGSRTNKNDSAGRRLGPKVYENNFVKPGQIIMRQRGTKIHPGENVGIGHDHTLFALEPGYVRFYLDPFHPLRKFVGVALRKDLQLPTPHFEPRPRRLGYEVLTGKAAAEEQAFMSRKETLAQPELKAKQELEASYKASKIKTCEHVLADSGLDEAQFALGAERLYFVGEKVKSDESLEFALEQATYSYIHNLELAARRGELSEADVLAKRSEHIKFADDFDSKFSVDCAGNPYKVLAAEVAETKKSELRLKLEEFAGRVPSLEDKATINATITTPGVFSRVERLNLKKQYLPSVLPETVPGTVLQPKGKKLPANAVPVRTFDPATRTLETVVRTKEAFL